MGPCWHNVSIMSRSGKQHGQPEVATSITVGNIVIDGLAKAQMYGAWFVESFDNKLYCTTHEGLRKRLVVGCNRSTPSEVIVDARTLIGLPINKLGAQHLCKHVTKPML